MASQAFTIIAVLAILVFMVQWFYRPHFKVNKSLRPGIYYFHTKRMSLAFDEVRIQSGELLMMMRGEIIGSVRCGYAAVFQVKARIEQVTGLEIQAA